jgi:hypothetical protein
VKTLQAEKHLACAIVICKMRKSAIVLYSFVVTACKKSIHPIIQNPVYSHSYYVTILIFCCHFAYPGLFNYILSNDKLELSSRGLIEVISQHLPGWTEQD